jgi:hypothetical protein
MNGKNRRVNGCFSRGSSTFQPINTKKTYNLPRFKNIPKHKIIETQKKLLNYFQNFPYKNNVEEYNFHANTPYSVIKLRQSHFKNGTVRITTPGIYVLQENITFNPNEENNFLPTINQTSIINPHYPMGMCGPYHLGFFAAITIETNDVILDLNKHIIKQSNLHALEQRFFSVIELANSPFIPKQGPGCFTKSNTYKSANNVLIHNGIIGRSSHHGIHGNNMKNIILNNIDIRHFEVAGIALNGSVNSIISNINIHDSWKKVPVKATYSAAKFVTIFLNKLKKNNPSKDLFLIVKNKKITYENIVTNLNQLLKTTKRNFINNNKFNNIFTNISQLSDGNIYGLLLHTNGVAINGFVKNRNSKSVGNENIYLYNININNISSHPQEVIGINPLKNDVIGAYGKGMMVGPVGEVLRILDILNDDKTYKEDPLSNAHMIIAKYNTPKIGTTNITQKIVEWVEKDKNLDNVMVENKLYFINKGDSMAHTMKGNIGMFISCGLNIRADKIFISNVFSKGNNVGTSKFIENDKQNKQGATCNGVLFTGSKNIFVNGAVNNIKSESGSIYEHKKYCINSFDVYFNNIKVILDE